MDRLMLHRCQGMEDHHQHQAMHPHRVYSGINRVPRRPTVLPSLDLAPFPSLDTLRRCLATLRRCLAMELPRPTRVVRPLLQSTMLNRHHRTLVRLVTVDHRPGKRKWLAQCTVLRRRHKAMEVPILQPPTSKCCSV